MKKRLAVFIVMIGCLLLAAIPSSGEAVRENPSFYSVAEIVQNLPQMWMAPPSQVTEMMKYYPDFTCWRGTDTIGCQSNNNRNSAEIYLSLNFTSEDDNAEFQHVSFSMQINSTEDVQKVIEAFWLDDLQPANLWGAEYPEGQVTMYFSSENTLVTYSIPFTETGVSLIRAEFGLIRG